MEALCDERVSNALTTKIQERILNEFNVRIEAKFKELLSEINITIMSTVKEISMELIKDSLLLYKQEINQLNERLHILEQRSYQNDLYISGLKTKASEVMEDSSTNQNQSSWNKSLEDMVINHINQDLDIQIEKKDINYIFRPMKKNFNNATPPILISFNTSYKK